MSRGTLACLLSDSNFKVRPFSVCSSDTLLACALASVGQLLRLWFFQGGFFCFRQEFSFSQSFRFFSFILSGPCWGPCNNPHQKKKITVTAKYKTQHNNLSSLLKNGFKPGSSLSRAKAGNCTTDCNSPDTLSLSFSAVSHIRLTWHTDVYYTTHTIVGCRASPPQGWEVYSTIWLSIV